MTDEKGARATTTRDATYTIADPSLRRRYLASLRMPPLQCGCRDPLSRRHVEDRCRYRRRMAEMERCAERINAELGRPVDNVYAGGPVDWETGAAA